MADNPPDLGGLDGLDLAAQVDTAQTQFWRNLWPWDDLSAKSPPERWLEFQKDIMPVLAALVASGGSAPRLLSADSLGRLQTSAVPNVVTTLTAPIAIGAGTFFVADGRAFPGGSLLYLSSSPTGGGLHTAGPYMVLSSGPVGITIVGTINQPFVVGDYVVAVPTMVVDGEGPTDRPVDLAQFNLPAIGNAGLITFAGIPNLQWKLAYLTASLTQTGATAGRSTLRIWDGPSGTGTQIYTETLSVDGTAGHIDRLPMPRLPLKATRGNALTIDTTGPTATGLWTLAAGAWSVPQLR